VALLLIFAMGMIFLEVKITGLLKQFRFQEAVK
jgi:hypothetical protein